MPRKPKLEIGWPVRNDLYAMVDIYNQAIRSGIATGHTQEVTRNQRLDWYRSHDKMSFPLYVLKLENKIIGYGTLSPYRVGRQAMRRIAEVSFFLDEAYQGKGFGSLLLAKMIYDCDRIDIHTLIAILLDVNKKSVRLLKKFGFKKWGHFRDIIEFDDKTCGQLIYGIKVSDKNIELEREQLIKIGYDWL